MKVNSKLLQVIEEIVKSGVTVETAYCREYNSIYFNLNTGMKSHLYAYPTEEGVTFRGRYGYELELRYEELELEEIIYQVQRCNHGRGFYNSQWASLFDQFGVKIPSDY